VVVHPTSETGVAEALAACEDVDVISPDSSGGVVDALDGGAGGILVTPRVGWSNEYLRSGLRWVQSQSAGYEGFPLEEFRRRDVVFTTGRGLHPVCAEHAIGLLLMLVRGTHHAMRNMARHAWERVDAYELAGQTVVVAGLGTIGEGIARRLDGWEAALIGLTRDPSRYVGTLTDVRPLTRLREACAEASALMLALPETPATREIVSGAVLDALGPGWLVNVSRGSVVDETALVDRLKDGRLRGAGLDVLCTEPLPAASALWDLPNVVLTPHMAGRSPTYAQRFAALMADNLKAFRGEGAWRNRIC
jgi:phosphoglycerate dehydrogenase-like enzyme